MSDLFTGEIIEIYESILVKNLTQNVSLNHWYMPKCTPNLKMVDQLTHSV